MARELDELFRQNFELGMYELWTGGRDETASLLIQMATYFARFDLSPGGNDDYSLLLTWLRDHDLVSRTAFATLNYECLLDIAANRAGLLIAHTADHRGPVPPGNVSPGDVLIYKPHGACNVLPDAHVYNATIAVSGAEQGYFDGNVRIVTPVEVLQLYRQGYALPPAMSLFAPGKHTPVARTFAAQESGSRHHFGNFVR
ncbi:MAG: hypothetical protein M3069_07615 [Chloroflexota bacterium]|nr:hypothetical protein [Chloroflexota bacterium]